ncbi:hypothetical protein [Methylobacterium sp. W2]|uniref:hypothetical protein n=1 Tax=Methylobacterium sp. W2 TaxID=2598107 RepID=UPI001D0C1E15|nr:hypothetical protein [Methylobacterium sp. W2]
MAAERYQRPYWPDALQIFPCPPKNNARPKTKPKFFMAFAKSHHWEYTTVIEA